jgi:hypothetical protein
VIGASRQLVSALLNDLEAEGALERKRHRLILRESKVRELLMHRAERRQTAAPPSALAQARPARELRLAGRLRLLLSQRELTQAV